MPQFGMCLLGSFNLTKYIKQNELGKFIFDYDKFEQDILDIVPAMDNIIDTALYPLPEQQDSAHNKRRIGIGITGLANAMEILGYPYGSEEGFAFTEEIMITLRNNAYYASIRLAEKKGPFPYFDANKYLESDFAKSLPWHIRADIKKNGIRNSHLLSIAPTGTISLTADNISSGIEPVFTKEYTRTMNLKEGTKTVVMKDYAWDRYGVEPVSADELPVETHVRMLTLCSKYVDSACSKTCNVGADVSWDRFKNAYMQAYDEGASGCTTFRAAGKRYGILNKIEEPKKEEGTACFIDPVTGQPQCS